MSTKKTPSLATLIAEFRSQVANYTILMREGYDGVDTVRNSYGPVLEALQSPPPARNNSDITAALLYLLDFGNLSAADEVMLRAAMAGLSPEPTAQAKNPAGRQNGEHKGAVAG